MIPQDPRAPARQQRWIELKNVGSETIPAFGACQVLDSERPEKDGVQTPQDGRTVLHVSVPLQNEPCAWVINGPCPIPSGDYGKPGTKDSPMLALVAYPVAAGLPLGIMAGSFYLWPRLCGFIADGDYDALSQTERVTRYDNCSQRFWVRATMCIPLGQGGYVQPQHRSPGETHQDDPDRGLIWVSDPLCWLFAVVDEIFLVERDNCDYNAWIPAVPYGLTRRVRVYETVDCGETGSGLVLLRNVDPLQPDCDPVATICYLTFCNLANRALAVDVEQEDVMAVAMPGECVFKVPVAPRAMRAEAYLRTKLCSEETAEIRDTVALDVCTWEISPQPTVVDNPNRLAGCVNDRVELAWNETERQWEIVQVQHHLVSRLLMNVGQSDCTIWALVVKQVALQGCGGGICDSAEQETIITLTDCTFVSDVRVTESTDGSGGITGCSVQYKRGTACVLGQCVTADWTTILNAECEDVLIDVYQQSTNLAGTFKAVCVLCLGTEWDQTLVTGTDCPAGT